MHFREFIQPLQVPTLITYCTWIYCFKCKCVTASRKIRPAGEVKVRRLCVCVCSLVGCWFKIRPALCLRAKETVYVSPSSLILTHLLPPPLPCHHIHIHMLWGLTPVMYHFNGCALETHHTHTHRINPRVSIFMDSSSPCSGCDSIDCSCCHGYRGQWT